MRSEKLTTLASIAIIILLASCATPGDRTLASVLSPQEKADILIGKGADIYDGVLANGNIEALEAARQCFDAALYFDPDNAKATQALDDIGTYVSKKRAAYVATATALLKTANRTDAQNYALLIAVRKAATLQSSAPDVQKLLSDTEIAKKAFLEKRNAELSDLAAKIAAEKRLDKMQKNLKRADVVTDEIFAVDPGNSQASKSANQIESTVRGLLGADIELAKSKLAQKKYAEAETALLRAEKSLDMASDTPSPEIVDLKYQLYFNWGASLYDAKKYQSAADKTGLALKAKKTVEAATLKAKIAKAASARDYDAEIDDTIDAIDSRLADVDPAGALQIIQANAGKLKNKANVAKLDAKKTAALALRDQLYKEGISLYNDEDYDGAKQKFRIVVDIDPAYEQAQSYLDKTNTKIKALAGGN